MDKMKNHELLIDEDCYLCKNYGAYLAKRSEVKVSSYQKASAEENDVVDFEKAKNQIAIIDHETNTAKYGVDALLIAFKSSYPSAVRFFSSGFTYRFAKFAYDIIALNRKVISPPIKKSAIDCDPSFNIKFRSIYIGITAIFTSIVLFFFCRNMFEALGYNHSFGKELLICLGQIVWQSLVFFKWNTEKKMSYLGNMMTVSLIGAILLVPGLLIKLIFSTSWIFDLVYFFIVVNTMLFEHMRRCKLLTIGLLPSISWVMYRVVVLAIILFLAFK